MRKKPFIAALLFSTTYAVSLSNFERISPSVPARCQEEYNKEIPFCSRTDFTNGCSPHCITGLYTKAEEVSGACENVSATGNTLLGVVLSGGMVHALCPQPMSKMSKISSTATPTATSKQDADPTTLFLITESTPTRTFGPRITLTHFTTLSGFVIKSSSSVTSTVSGASTTSTNRDTPALTISSISKSSQIQSPSPSPDKSDKDPRPKPSSDKSGGGSPFDDENYESNATYSEKSSFCAMVIFLIWAFIFQR
ncbi:hypothetical protein GcM1_234088 [Golovinomyces cichoracearum]|uniref:Uncharacterized protein n=1 Tax=Golovinomyces cichoracearum TaxID=62708 RepID=A0A420ILH3_9PEZI|nr:hypothetical protein GcM1_234088 [Golovinomyces cichoracearum]